MTHRAASDTITIVVTETSTPFPPCSPWPLLYTLKRPPSLDSETLKALVALERYREIVDTGDPETEDQIAQVVAIAEGLAIHMVFDGEPTMLHDWRH